MREQAAIRVALNFRRYRIGKTGKSAWDQDGPYTPQWIIPMATRKERGAVNRVMGTKGKVGRIAWIDVSKVRSTQSSLRHKSLMHHIRNHKKWQKTFGRSKDMDIRGVNLPIIVYAEGVPIIWNGNHRITANILLGKQFIQVRMFKRGRK